MKCPNCGLDYPAGANLCLTCGVDLIAQKPKPSKTQYIILMIRLASDTIDFALVAISLYILSLLFVLPRPQWENVGLSFSLWLVSLLLFYLLYEWLFIGIHGQTLGKMILHIRVVDESGNIPGLKRAALRELLWKPILSFLIPIIFVSYAFPFSFGAPPTLHWDAKIAGTYVVKVIQKPKVPASHKQPYQP
jgi:uncharacterized RDD family membrane protein YckC